MSSCPPCLCFHAVGTSCTYAGNFPSVGGHWKPLCRYHLEGSMNEMVGTWSLIPEVVHVQRARKYDHAFEYTARDSVDATTIRRKNEQILMRFWCPWKTSVQDEGSRLCCLLFWKTFQASTKMCVSPNCSPFQLYTQAYPRCVFLWSFKHGGHAFHPRASWKYGIDTRSRPISSSILLKHIASSLCGARGLDQMCFLQPCIPKFRAACIHFPTGKVHASMLPYNKGEVMHPYIYISASDMRGWWCTAVLLLYINHMRSELVGHQMDAIFRIHE